MVEFLSIFFFLGFLQFLLGFSKVPVFLCHPVYVSDIASLLTIINASDATFHVNLLRNMRVVRFVTT